MARLCGGQHGTLKLVVIATGPRAVDGTGADVGSTLSTELCNGSALLNEHEPGA